MSVYTLLIIFITAHKTPAAYHGQRRQLERAKTGDMLKAKIQQRPPRQELERRHILESDHVDPSLAERQRMLKKARLADQLNDQLSHRPGPLELIQKNILHTEEPIENAVKAGKIPYKATCEGQLNRPQHPHIYINPEDDSQSSESDTIASPGPSEITDLTSKTTEILVSIIPTTDSVMVTNASPLLNAKNNEVVMTDICQSGTSPILSHTSVASPVSLMSSTSTLSPLSSIASPSPLISQPATPSPSLPINFPTHSVPSSAKTDAPGKDKNRKKAKPKSAPKIRTIKFHEYKGPPNAQKPSPQSNNSTSESSYDLLLQQQTLLLQFQLQLQHKYPQIILPASQKTTNDSSVSNSSQSSSNPSTSTDMTSSKMVGRLEDMKVSDLKAELKRRSLPVSGSKPQLIERLKPFTTNDMGSSQTSNTVPESVTGKIDNFQTSPQRESDSPILINAEDIHEQMEIGEPLSPLSVLSHNQENISQKTQEDLVREQQKQIEELQRELTLSQLKLQAAQRAEHKKSQVLALQKHLQTKQASTPQSQFQSNSEPTEIQHFVAIHNQKNMPNMPGNIIFNGNDAAIVLNHLIQGKAKFIENKQEKTNILPNFLNTLVTPLQTFTPVGKMDYQEEIKPPSITYDNILKENTKKEKSNVKSQTVDDVLEILIKNGELPPSAAHDPATPGSAGTKNIEPIFQNNNCTLPLDSLKSNNNNINYIPNPHSPDSTLGLDSSDLIETLDTLENMDFGILVKELGYQQSNENTIHNESDQISVAMDTDEWLESLLPTENSNCMTQNPIVSHETNLKGFDPLLGVAQNPLDAFLLDDFRSSVDSASWDKVDFAA